METIVTTISDTFLNKYKVKKKSVLFCVCLMMYLIGLLICTEGGIYILQLMDNYCASFSALIIGLTEIIAIAWVYGVDKFLDNCKTMLGHYPYKRTYWKIIWKYVVPLIILVSINN